MNEGHACMHRSQLHVRLREALARGCRAPRQGAGMSLKGRMTGGGVGTGNRKNQLQRSVISKVLLQIL